MLALIVVAIMLGFPTAFTLMGMGVFFAWLAYRSVNPDIAVRQVLDLMVQRAYAVMSNDVLIAIPLFVFMGYLVERAALIEQLFKSLHLAMARVPGSLAVATIVTCAIFATATGIVGAVVTLMGLLALPAMLKAGYNIKLSAGRDHRRRLPRHPDPAVGAADRLRRDRRRLGGAALRRRVLPRDHARGPVRRLRDHHREAQAAVGAAALRGRATVPIAGEARSRSPPRARNAFSRAARRRSAAQPAACRRARCWASSSCRCCPRSAIAAHRRRSPWIGATKPAEVVDVSGFAQSGFDGPSLDEPGRARGAAAPKGELAEPPDEGPRRRRRRPAADAPAAKADGGRAAAKAAAEPATAGDAADAPTWFWVMLAIGAALTLLLYLAVDLGSGSKCSRCCSRRSSRWRC